MKVGQSNGAVKRIFYSRTACSFPAGRKWWMDQAGSAAPAVSAGVGVAFGCWPAGTGPVVTPGSNFGSDVMLFKVGLVCAFAYAGARPDAIGAKSPRLPDIQIDTLRPASCVLYAPARSGPKRVAAPLCSLCDLDGLERIGRNFHFWDGRGISLWMVYRRHVVWLDNLTFSLAGIPVRWF